MDLDKLLRTAKYDVSCSQRKKTKRKRRKR